MLVVGILLITFVGCEKKEEKKVQNTPTEISVWTYYTGRPKEEFDKLIKEFNAGVGKEKKIAVRQHTFGGVQELNESLISSAKDEAASMKLPNLFITYKGVAKSLARNVDLIDFNQHLTEPEKQLYVKDFLELGTVEKEGQKSLIMIPVGISSTLTVLNNTDYEALSKLGLTYRDLETYEGIVKAAETYYQYTDGLTPEKNDGLALFGIDSVANYFFEGMKEQGVDFLSVEDGKTVAHMDKDKIRKLWDNYYRPTVQGYFGKYGKFSSDDIKTGKILFSLSSSTTSSFFPDHKFIGEHAFDIDMGVLPPPHFADLKGLFLIQGGGMIGIKKSREEDWAAIEFAKWISTSDKNSDFTISSAYLPITQRAFTEKYIAKYAKKNEISPKVQKALDAAFNQYRNRVTYYIEPLDGYEEIRKLIDRDFGDFANDDARQLQSKRASEQEYLEALEECLSDAYFDAWYESFERKVKKILDEANRG